jgi:hypothetical protein
LKMPKGARGFVVAVSSSFLEPGELALKLPFSICSSVV